MTKFKVGDKVRILGKSRGCSPRCSPVYQRCQQQGYGYIVRTCFGEPEVHYDKAPTCGDFSHRPT